jgi:NitT/TauT family transport system permease protein
VAFILSLGFGAVIWQLLGTYLLDPDLISSPVLVVLEMIELHEEGLLVPNVYVTLQRTFLAMVVTTIVGTVIGVLAGWNEFTRGMFQDYILVGLGLPTLLAAVFATIWFGPNPATPTIAATLLAFPFLSLNVKNAVENIDADLAEMSRSFNVSRRRAFRRLILMSVLSEWFSGMRNAYTVTWKIVTVAEFVAFSNGVGFYIAESVGLLSMDAVLAWTLSFSIIIIALEYAIFQTVEQRVFDWREEGTIGVGAI